MASCTCSRVQTGFPGGETAEIIAKPFVERWVVIFGVASTMATQFESALFTNHVTGLGTKRVRTTAYHPQANELVERFHRQLKAALRVHADPTKWNEALPLVLLDIRTAVKADLQCSAAEMVFGTSLRVPGQFFHSAPAHQWPDHSHTHNVFP